MARRIEPLTRGFHLQSIFHLLLLFCMSKERIQGQPDIESIAISAKETLLRDGHHLPMVIGVGNEGQGIAQLAGNLETNEERTRAMWILGKVFRKDGRLGQLHKVFFVSEGWMSVATKTSGNIIRPSQDPSRLEVLVVSELDLLNRKTNMLLYEMVRNEKGELREIKPYQVDGGKSGLETRSSLLEAFFRGYYSENAKGNGKHLH